MGIISWLIVGLIVSLVISRLGRPGSTGTDWIIVIVGVVGALIGGAITNLVMFLPLFGFSWGSIIVSGLSSLVFTIVAMLLRKQA